MHEQENVIIEKANPPAVTKACWEHNFPAQSNLSQTLVSGRPSNEEGQRYPGTPDSSEPTKATIRKPRETQSAAARVNAVFVNNWIGFWMVERTATRSHCRSISRRNASKRSSSAISASPAKNKLLLIKFFFFSLRKKKIHLNSSWWSRRDHHICTMNDWQPLSSSIHS